MKWIIEMPEGWKPENKAWRKGQPTRCEMCPFVEALTEDGDNFCGPTHGNRKCRRYM